MPMPRVVILLAVYNGMPWLPEQIESILAQRDVQVRIVISDDGSTDGSVEWVQARAPFDGRIRMLPMTVPSGSAAANFRRLIADADVAEGELVAFADQDDIWHSDKLARHAALISTGADGVSSSVDALYPDGSRVLIRKDWPQRKWDFLTEGPGPGCSQLLSASGFALVRRVVLEVPEAAETEFHDWLTYVALRAAGRRWVIDGPTSLDYRQHAGNVLGANRGINAAIARLGMIGSLWHRRQAAINARIALAVAERIAPNPSAPDGAELRELLGLFEQRGPRARIALARRTSQLRRRPRDQLTLSILIAGGIW